MYMIKQLYSPFDFWSKDLGFVRDINKASTYKAKNHAEENSSFVLMPTEVASITDYDFESWLIYDGNKTFFNASFDGFDQLIEDANNGLIKWQDWNCYVIDLIFEKLDLFNGLEIERDVEHSCCYYYFDNMSDAIEFTKRLKVKIWPKHWR